MNNANDPAYPCLREDIPFWGLTKREYFAGLAMQELLNENAHERYDEIAKWAVKHADALLAKLKKTEGQKC